MGERDSLHMQCTAVISMSISPKYSQETPHGLAVNARDGGGGGGGGGGGVCCEFKSLIYLLPPSPQCCMKYRDWFNRVITALSRIKTIFVQWFCIVWWNIKQVTNFRVPWLWHSKRYVTYIGYHVRCMWPIYMSNRSQEIRHLLPRVKADNLIILSQLMLG